jgi:exopolyphosphatase / guanosine-5'-triphosphate,3'-diphosphate pyrophosphatase
MKIAEISKDEPPKIVEHVRRTLAIGSDTYLRGTISQAVLDECLAVLSDFTSILKSFRIGASRVVATSAFREARNGAFAADQIRRASDLEIEILSNASERYYHILAAIAAMPDFRSLVKEGTLLVDIGAGSIQLTVYNQGELVFSQNMLLGSLRIRELLADLERRTADFAGLMEEYISSDLDSYHLLEPKGIAYKNLILIGGETDHLKRLAGQEPGLLSAMSSKQFGQLYQQLLTSRPLDLALERTIAVEHASLLLPSAIIIRKLLDFTSAKTIFLPAASLCDGILVDFARSRWNYHPGYDQTPDILSACRQLARRFETDRKHGEFVEKAALQLFDETSRLHNLPARSRILLQAAAILHDCGKHINMTQHNTHSYNMIMASEIIGLQPAEQEIVAWTARLHSGRTTLEESRFQTLSREDQLQVAKLAALLRLADALDTGHRQKIGEFTVGLSSDALIVTVSARRDITLEVWTFENKGELFREVYGVGPLIKIRRQLT